MISSQINTNGLCEMLARVKYGFPALLMVMTETGSNHRPRPLVNVSAGSSIELIDLPPLCHQFYG